MRKIALCLAALCVVTTGVAEAKDTHRSICERAYSARVKVIHRHGRRAPGRNICRQGVRVRHRTRPATVREKWNYLVQLRHLTRPAPAYLVRVAVPPRRPPAGALSSAYAPVGIAACIVQRESRGNPRALSPGGKYRGLAQWALTTWRAQGGPQMTGQDDPINATEQQQLAVLSHALATKGSGAWGPFDGCG